MILKNSSGHVKSADRATTVNPFEYLLWDPGAGANEGKFIKDSALVTFHLVVRKAWGELCSPDSDSLDGIDQLVGGVLNDSYYLSATNFMIFYAFLRHHIPTNVALSKKGIKVVFRESFGRIRVKDNQLRRIRESQNRRIEKLSSFGISLDGVTWLIIVKTWELVYDSEAWLWAPYQLELQL
jgi:hypothetical protein